MNLRSAKLLAVAFSISSVIVAAEAREVDVKLPGCEFTFKLPVAPKVSEGRAASGAAIGPSMLAEVQNRVPGYRSECQSFSRMPPGARDAFVDDTLGQIAGLALKDAQQTVRRTRLGVVIEFSGINRQANVPFVVSGKNILGRTSVFSLVVTEPAEAYPSEEAARVLNSVRKQ